MLEEIIGELDPVAEDKGVTIKRESVNDLRFRNANRALVFSMFYNVINNAVKNTGPGGIITVTTKNEKGRFKVEIGDSGRGMDEAQLSSLFSRFRAKRENDENGTGIGLAIAKTIADFHNIEVSVISSPGKGTQFSFIFPETS
jgi:signal transduction histidine kinase